jgi:hypothetical protein
MQLVLLLTIFLQSMERPVCGQTTAVIFQGRIESAFTPPDGIYDLKLQLFDSAGGGLAASGVLQAIGAPVTNATFVVIGDFGAEAYTGANRWLEVAYRSNSLSGDFQTNAIRIPIVSVPYAVQALRAVGVSGPVAATNLIGIIPDALLSTNIPRLGDSPIFAGSVGAAGFVGSGAGLTNLLAGNLTGLVQDSLLSTNVVLLAGTNVFTGTNNFSGVAILTNGNNRLAGTFSGSLVGGTLAGNGAGITNVNGGSVQAKSIPGAALADGQVVRTLNGLTDGVSLVAGTNVFLSLAGRSLVVSAISGPVGPSWGLSGNAGTGSWSFLGTTDNQPVEMRVNGLRALRLEPASAGEVNVIGGLSSNAVAAGVQSAVIAGGGEAKPGGSNYISASYSYIGGGRRNGIGSAASDSLIGGGLQNSVLSPNSLVAGGTGNSIGTNSPASVIGGGAQNTIPSNAGYAAVGGGVANSPSSSYSTIVGGAYNAIQPGANQAAIVGGYLNLVQSNSPNSVIVAGANNTVSNAASYSVIVGGYLNAIGGGAQTASIGGGRQNAVLAQQAVVAGGIGNLIAANSPSSVIGGGSGGGIQANAGYSVIGGGLANVVQTGAQYATIAGGVQNSIGTNAQQAAVMGGYSNRVGSNALNAAITGGAYNTISNNANFAIVLGGNQNLAGGVNSLAAGNRAKASHTGSFVWADATVADFSSTGPNQFLVRASGGVGIGVTAPQSALHVGGAIIATNFVGNGAGLTNLSLSGVNLTGSLSAAQIPGLDAAKIVSGTFNPAQIPALDAAVVTSGRLADARLGTNVALLNSSPVFSGPVVAPAFNYASDRNLKQGFKAIVGAELLDKLGSLPITRWVYKNDPEAEHIGPMAQDFHRVFAVGGGDDKHISAVDATGVALAAIQVLMERLRAKDTELAELRLRLERLESSVGQAVGGK